VAGVTSSLAEAIWPEFMRHDAVCNRHWGDLYGLFPEFQFALFDVGTGECAAAGNSIPLAWDGDTSRLPDEGWDWAVEKGVADRRAGREPTVLCAVQVMVAPAWQGRGVSYRAVEAMKRVGVRRGFPLLVVPVRPTLKSRYPLTPMARYACWTDEEGLPIDPWLRVHVRLDGEVVGVCPRSMTIQGSVGDWESWTGMRFPESDRYVVPGALVPVEIDREADRGVYVEPNIWMCHPLS
jgi:GNAT superfamily N-acetyltransferase